MEFLEVDYLFIGKTCRRVKPFSVSLDFAVPQRSCKAFLCRGIAAAVTVHVDAESAFVLWTEIARLSNRPTQGDRSGVIRAGVRSCAAARPTGKIKARIGFAFNDHSRSGVTPAAARLHCAARPRSHRQEILCLECRRINFVSRRRDNVGDRSVVTPFLPDILHTRAPALR